MKKMWRTAQLAQELSPCPNQSLALWLGVSRLRTPHPLKGGMCGSKAKRLGLGSLLHARGLLRSVACPHGIMSFQGVED